MSKKKKLTNLKFQFKRIIIFWDLLELMSLPRLSKKEPGVNLHKSKLQLEQPEQEQPEQEQLEQEARKEEQQQEVEEMVLLVVELQEEENLQEVQKVEHKAVLVVLVVQSAAILLSLRMTKK